MCEGGDGGRFACVAAEWVGDVDVVLRLFLWVLCSTLFVLMPEVVIQSVVYFSLSFQDHERHGRGAGGGGGGGGGEA